MAQTSRRIQGKRCVAYGCSNTYKDEVSMHTFPSRDTEARKQWVDFVKKDRADWEPTRYSNLCSAHFAPECFPVKYRILELYGKAVRYKSLIKGSVPTIDAVFDTITVTREELPLKRKISFKSITRQKKVSLQPFHLTTKMCICFIKLQWNLD